VKYDLASMVKASGTRRSTIPLRPIAPTATQAGDLYAAAYKPIISALQRAADRLTELYGRSLPITDGFRDAASDDFAAFFNDLSEELQRILLEITPDLRDWALRVERYHREKWRASVLTATELDLAMILLGSGTPVSVQESIDWNVSLIRNVSDEARGRMSSQVFAAYRRRAPAAELAKDLRGSVKMSRRRSLNIAADQTQKLSASLDQERQTDAGIEEYTWRHSRKLHPRAFHVEREGKEFRWDSPPPDGPPGSLPFCGCKGQARLRLE